ncbi:MAG: tail fiber domain-containing protein [Acidobacteria bacterium]|nr:tail fiber domain-containing protein [Acidobacteriota bacterium]
MKKTLFYVILMLIFVVTGFSQEREREKEIVMGSAIPFTYQGKLTVGGTAANGSFDLIIQLYNESERGDLLGEQTIEGVQVANGIFTVNLEFETGLFHRFETSYLDIWVRPSEGGEYTQLTPRQQIGSMPYSKIADRSKEADSLNCSNCITDGQIVSLDGSKITGTVANAADSHQLGGVDANQYVRDDDERLTNERAPTAGSANYIQNSTAQQTSSNFNISGNGVINGRLGVGGSSSAYRIYVVGGTQTAVRGESTNSFGVTGTSTSGIGVRGESELDTGVVGQGDYAGVIGTSADGFGVRGQSTNNIGVTGISTDGTGVRGQSTTNVGVNGTSTNGIGVSGSSTNTHGVFGTTSHNSNASAGVFGSSTGGVGVRGQSNSRIGVEGISLFDHGVTGTSTTSDGVRGTSTGPGAGVRGVGGVYGVYGQGGNYGVYGESTSYAGWFQGNVFITGTLSNPSDARLKTDIGTLNYGLRDVMRLRPVTWLWKDRPDRGTQLGLIAQEVETVMPELVSNVKSPEKDVEETKALNYTGLIPVLINAVQEQQTEIETLKAENKKAKAENAELTKRLAALEKALETLSKEKEN